MFNTRVRYRVCSFSHVGRYFRYLNVAVDDCVLKKKKTITGPDIINAMYKLGFEKYGDALKDYLDKYREQLENQSESLD